MYYLDCIAPDGEWQQEKNDPASCPVGFDSIEAAQDRNDEMGSRWVMYPIRVISNTARNIVRILEGADESWVGKPLDDLIGHLVEQHYAALAQEQRD